MSKQQIALEKVREKYPDMTMQEYRDTLKLAFDNIRKDMKKRGYILPDSDDELMVLIRDMQKEIDHETLP